MDNELFKVHPCIKRIPVLLQVELFFIDGFLTVIHVFYEDIIECPATVVNAYVDPVIIQNEPKIKIIKE